MVTVDLVAVLVPAVVEVFVGEDAAGAEVGVKAIVLPGLNPGGSLTPFSAAHLAGSTPYGSQSAVSWPRTDKAGH